MRHSKIYERVKRAAVRSTSNRQLTVQQVARRLSVSESTVRRTIAAGELVAMRVGKAAWRVSEEDLERFRVERTNSGG